jgi:hypothetical protein
MLAGKVALVTRVRGQGAHGGAARGCHRGTRGAPSFCGPLPNPRGAEPPVTDALTVGDDEPTRGNFTDTNICKTMPV